jgi:hypothetical protein
MGETTERHIPPPVLISLRGPPDSSARCHQPGSSDHSDACSKVAWQPPDSPMSQRSQSGKKLLSPTTSSGLKKLRGQLPRPWPSCYAVFEMIKGDKVSAS